MATTKPKSLGQVLKESRELKGLSLRDVEEETNISNAYVSQLENNKIQKPSADILHKLSNLYKIDFGFLLSSAGLVEKATDINKSFGEYVFSKENLSNEEEEELIRYLKFIRQKQNN